MRESAIVFFRVKQRLVCVHGTKNVAREGVLDCGARTRYEDRGARKRDRFFLSGQPTLGKYARTTLRVVLDRDMKIAVRESVNFSVENQATLG